MVYKLKRLYLNVMFELYGVLHNCLMKVSNKALDYGEKYIDKRDDILEQLFT